MIDPDGADFPYVQLANILTAQIESGELRPGARVPSITTLVQTYGVGKNTARKALTLLEERGLVVIRQSWGTFVKGQ
jgi:GntR family transcriptional regulator